MISAKVYLWNSYVGAIVWDAQREIGQFQYDPGFVASGLQIAPIHMPLSATRVYEFPSLNRDTYKRLPAALADCLPDDFGNALIDTWLAQQGREKSSFSPVERLLYTGQRGMGALEFRPATKDLKGKSEHIQLDSLVQLAAKVLDNREAMTDQVAQSSPEVEDEALRRLIQVGTSAGGARAKAVIAINDKGAIRSGQVKAPAGFSYWLLKFDVPSNARELADSQGYGRIEYAYYLMARAAGIQMTECRLLEEGGRAHFMTKRFDRTDDGDKIHVQTLCAMDHADYNMPGAYSYEQAFGLMRVLRFSRADAEQFFKRMVFNVVARNQDDHTKNISFVMDPAGRWSLSPAYDVAWSYKPGSEWVSTHQMTINGKRDDLTIDDLKAVARQIARFDPNKVIREVSAAVKRWPEFASQANVAAAVTESIGKTHRLFK